MPFTTVKLDFMEIEAGKSFESRAVPEPSSAGASGSSAQSTTFAMIQAPSLSVCVFL